MVIPVLITELASEAMESAAETIPTENIQDFLSGKTDSPFADEENFESQTDKKTPAENSGETEKTEDKKIDPNRLKVKSILTLVWIWTI